MKPTPEQLEQRIRELEDNQRKILAALKTANILISGLNAPPKKGSILDRAELWEKSPILGEAGKPE